MKLVNIFLIVGFMFIGHIIIWTKLMHKKETAFKVSIRCDKITAINKRGKDEET